MTNEELDRKSNFLTNTAYVTALALDLMIRESERLLGQMQPKQGWKFEKKRMFNQYADYVRKACVINEQLISQDIVDVEKGEGFKYYDVWQHLANEFARFILLISDRSHNPELIEEIHNFILSHEGIGNADEKLLDAFRMK